MGDLSKIADQQGKLDENIVPKEHKKLHDELILIRDKFFAHSDSSPAPTFQQVSNELRFRREGPRIGSFVTRFLIDPSHFASMLPLLDSLIKKTDYHTQKLCNHLAKKLAKAGGQYTANIQNLTGPLFSKSETILADIRHTDS